MGQYTLLEALKLIRLGVVDFSFQHDGLTYIVQTGGIFYNSHWHYIDQQWFVLSMPGVDNMLQALYSLRLYDVAASLRRSFG